MILTFKILQKLIKLFINFLFALQIVLMILVFFSAAYWFFGVAGFDFFMFAEPIVNAISDFVNMFYKTQITMGDTTIDGSILLFDIVSILIVFIISKSKYYLFIGAKFIDDIIENLVQQEENRFNEALRIEEEKRILNYNKAAVIVRIELKDATLRKYRKPDQPKRDVNEKEETAFKMLYALIKNTDGCKFAKNGNELVIMIDNFSLVDDVLLRLNQIINKIREDLAEDKWETYCYAGIDAYDENINFKKTVFSSLKNLIKIKHTRGVTCYGNFKLRYQYKENQQYQVELFDSGYAIDGGSYIYVLVKKN